MQTRNEKEYSQAELYHKTETKCLISIFGNVYNVAKYLSKHPGGEQVLYQAGGDILDDVFEDGNHRHLKNRVGQLLQPYKVGVLKK